MIEYRPREEIKFDKLVNIPLSKFPFYCHLILDIGPWKIKKSRRDSGRESKRRNMNRSLPRENSLNIKRPVTAKPQSMKRNFHNIAVNNYYDEKSKLSHGFRIKWGKDVKMDIWEYNKKLITESLHDINTIQGFMNSLGK